MEVLHGDGGRSYVQKILSPADQKAASHFVIAASGNRLLILNLFFYFVNSKL